METTMIKLKFTSSSEVLEVISVTAQVLQEVLTAILKPEDTVFYCKTQALYISFQKHCG